MKANKKKGRKPLSSSEDEAFYTWLKQNILRRAFRRWPPYSLVLKRCKEEYTVGNRRRVGFRCEVKGCGRRVDRKEIAVDHITPVGAPTDIAELIRRMFCSIDNLQAICNYTLKAVADGKYEKPSCHYIKTQKERGNVPKTTEEIRKIGGVKKGGNTTGRKRNTSSSTAHSTTAPKKSKYTPPT